MAICRYLLGKLKLILLPICLILVLVYLPGSVNEIKISKNEKNSAIRSSNAALLRRSNLIASLMENDGTDGATNPVLKSPTLCINESLEGDAQEDWVAPERTGYVLALSYHEQQTQAISNLFTLQCWAKTLLVSVVEPFVVNSYFVLPVNGSKHERQVRLSGVVDLETWQEFTKGLKLAPLVSWHRFFTTAPRKLIVVRFRYLKPREYKLRKKLGEEHIHRAAMTDTYKKGCTASVEFEAKLAYMVDVLNFTVIRSVCLNFAHGDQVTLFQFNRHVYNGIRPRTVTTLMEEWRGFSAEKNGKRISLSNGCLLSSKVLPMAHAMPSNQLFCDAKKYTKWFMRTTNYIALVVRTEKMHSLTNNRTNMAKCLNNTLRAWRRVKKATGIQTTFLSMDIGKYGSYTLMERKGKVRYQPYTDLYTEFLKELFGSHATIRTWETGFEEAASNLEPGYIASLQKTIAAMSKCVILSGGGSFQKHLLLIYKKMHPTLRLCSMVIEDCSRGL